MPAARKLKIRLLGSGPKWQRSNRRCIQSKTRSYVRNNHHESKVVLVYIRCHRWAQKAWPLYHFFSTVSFINKKFYYDQMPVRRVDLHMLNSVWYNFQTAMLSLARDIQWSLKHCQTGEVWKLKILVGNSNFKIWVAEITSSQPWVVMKLHFLASFEGRNS